MKDKFIWYIKQLFPLDYYSNYKMNDKNIVTTWKMWFGKCYKVKNYEVV